MTDTLDRDTLIGLARHVGWPAVSIHLLTHRSGPEVLQDPIRFKNLLRQTEERLSGTMRSPEIEDLLAPAHALLDDSGFWRSSSEGLAMFIARDGSRIVRTAIALPELVSVGDRFTLRPLLPLLGMEARFYVLALSKKHVRLLFGNRDGMREIDLKDVPGSLAEALAYDDFERQLSFHTRAHAGTSGKDRGAIAFHGHGGIPEVDKENITHYFRDVDRGVSRLLHGEDAPLLLAGVDYLLPMYREVNSYPHLARPTLVGNPDERSESELQAAALEMLAPLFAAQVERDLERLRESEGASAASYDMSEIATAAHQGRVGVLFVTPEASAWGSWNPALARVEPHQEPLPGDWDLADLTAAETLMHGGVVHAVESIPHAGESVAAIFRY